MLKNYKDSGDFWRVMDTEGLKSMLQDKEICTLIETDDKIKRNLKNSKDVGRSDYLNVLNNFLKNKIIMDRAFLSTSIGGGISYGDLDKKSIVLKITGTFSGILISGFSKCPSEKEFLMPSKTKLKIVNVTNYDGKTKSSEIVNQCIQLNCVPG